MSKNNFLEVGDTSVFERKLLFNSKLDETPHGAPGPPGVGDQLNMGLGQLLTPMDKKERSSAIFVIPQPGFCVKTKDMVSKVKIFMNVCYADNVPEPNFDLPDDRLAQILSDGTDSEVEEIRLPMSIGDKHTNPDHTGTECTTIDVIVNTNFYLSRLIISELYKAFLVQVALEGIQEKHGFTLERNDYKILENRKSFGKLQPQMVRQKPLISEVDPSCPPPSKTIKFRDSGDSEDLLKPIQTTRTNPSTKTKPLIQEISSKSRIAPLELVLTQLSSTEAKAEVKIEGLEDTASLNVSVCPNRILIECPQGVVDSYLPEYIEIDVTQSPAFKSEYTYKNSTLLITFNVIEKP